MYFGQSFNTKVLGKNWATCVQVIDKSEEGFLRDSLSNIDYGLG
jgi:hypothetical protein